MRRYLLALATALVASSASAQFQTTTTNCQFVLGTMNCTSTTPQQQKQQHHQLNPSLMVTPNYSKNAVDAFEQARRIRLMEEQQRALAEQRRLMDRQAQQQTQPQQQQPAVDPVAQALEEHKAQSWEAAKMAAAGDCAGAEAYALSVGNLVLAKQVKDYCASAK